MTAPLARETERAELMAVASQYLARGSLADFIELVEPTYERARHTEVICQHLEAIERNEINRLIIQIQPRAGKTLHVSQAFPAWCLGRHPRWQIVLASYGAELAEGNSRKARSYVRSDRWPFECKVSEESRAQNRWQTDAGGVLIATGCEGGLTGYGADLLIIDDPVRDRVEAESASMRDKLWNWWTDVARTRLMPSGRVVLCQTRWHQDDLAGRILASPDGKRWTLLSLPAIALEGEPDALQRSPGEVVWPERFPLSELPSVERGEISSRSFAALYQQRPVPAEGAIFKSAWFETRYTDADLPPMKTIATGADCAAKTGVANDFSAILTIGTDGADFYVLDVVRQRLEFADLARRMVEVASRWNPERIYIEDASSGTPLVQELKRATHLPIIGCPPRGTKVARAEAVSGLFEAGKVRLPRDAPWLDVFIDEFLSFPAGKHDDQVDATSLVLSRLRARTSQTEWSFSIAKNRDYGAVADVPFARPH